MHKISGSRPEDLRLEEDITTAHKNIKKVGRELKRIDGKKSE